MAICALRRSVNGAIGIGMTRPLMTPPTCCEICVGLRESSGPIVYDGIRPCSHVAAGERSSCLHRYAGGSPRRRVTGVLVFRLTYTGNTVSSHTTARYGRRGLRWQERIENSPST